MQAVDLTGDREFLNSETAEQALAVMLTPDSTVTKVSNIGFKGCCCQCQVLQLQHGTYRYLQIKFSTKSFGIEAAEVAARAIDNVASSLTHADISDIIAGRPEKEVLGALQIISQSLAKAKLKALDLSDNALGQKGIIACTQAFAQQVSHPPRTHADPDKSATCVQLCAAAIHVWQATHDYVCMTKHQCTNFVAQQQRVQKKLTPVRQILLSLEQKHKQLASL